MNRALMIGGALVGAAGVTVAPSLVLVMIGAGLAVRGWDGWYRARHDPRRPGYIIEPGDRS